LESAGAAAPVTRAAAPPERCSPPWQPQRFLAPDDGSAAGVPTTRLSRLRTRSAPIVSIPVPVGSQPTGSSRLSATGLARFLVHDDVPLDQHVLGERHGEARQNEGHDPAADS